MELLLNRKQLPTAAPADSATLEPAEVSLRNVFEERPAASDVQE